MIDFGVISFIIGKGTISIRTLRFSVQPNRAICCKWNQATRHSEYRKPCNCG